MAMAVNEYAGRRQECVRAGVGRREVLKVVAVGIAGGGSAGCASAGARSGGGADASPGKAKVVFVLFRNARLTHDMSLAEWRGERHVSIVKKVPGLRKWVQNHVVSGPGEAAPDGIGELWFDDAEAMKKAMSSPEIGAAVED
ncbi:MAG: EthD family reductase, partial [Candidatus Rokuibacteriota bacterium]